MIKFVEKLKKQNIQVSLEKEDLKITYFGDDLSVELINEIKSKKQLLIQYLEESNNEDPKGNVIPFASMEDSYPLSNAQRRMLVLSQSRELNIAYNIHYAYRITGGLKKEYIQLACDDLIARHEILRTIFIETETGEVRQKVLSIDDYKLNLIYKDFENQTSKSDSLSDYLEKESLKLFDKGSPRFKLYLLKLDDEDFVLNYVTHHSVCDGWSMVVLMRDLFVFYEARIRDALPSLSPLKVQYKDYAVWESNKMDTLELSRSKKYWLEQFNKEAPILDLPVDKTRPIVRSYKGGLYHKIIDPVIHRGLKKILNEEKSTLFMGLLTTINILLHKYTNQDDITIGIPFSVRDNIDLEDQIGVYINSLPLRVNVDAEASFKTLLNQVKKLSLDAFKHGHYPFEQLIEDLGIKADKGKNPLFDVMVVLQNNNVKDSSELIQSKNDLQIQAYNDKGTEYVTSKFDLAFFFTDDQEKGLICGIEYNSDIYEQETIKFMADHLEMLLTSIASNFDIPIKDVSLLTSTEKELLLEKYNATEKHYPLGENIVSLFEEQVLKNLDGIALVYEGKEMTYDELNRVSNQLARYLLSGYELGKDKLVGIKMDRSLEMIISILGVLKSGSAYVPIDPNYPKERIDYMLEDSKCMVVLDSDLFNDFKLQRDSYKTDNLGIFIDSNDLIYVMYTSGTTGYPKGVMLTHRGIINMSFWHIEAFNVNHLTRTTTYSSYSFDVSVWELFPYLLKGSILYILSNELRLDLEKLNVFYKENEIKHSNLPTPICEKFLEIENDSLDYLFTGGDRLLKSENSGNYIFVNNYGPTENSVVSTTFTIDDASKEGLIPIGKPVSNTQIYILDKDLRLLPKGVIGEICVSGIGLARGYWNRPELTKEKFVPHPYVEGALLYRTGDLGRWRSDGHIEFVGRNDHQVKIRGHRIELGEISQTLAKHASIKDCVIKGVEIESGAKELACYYVCKEDISILEIRNYLGALLPSYMIPSYYMEMEAIPLTSNGKVDRKSLPIPSDFDLDTEIDYLAPRNEVEEKLVEIWSDVLSIKAKKIGVKDDFFYLGGHSLKATIILAKIRTVFKVNLDISDLYVAPTVEGVSKEVLRKQWMNDEVSNDENNIKIEL